uniref:outer membrane protein n=1 Tax=Parerythrobacter lutipelagi TaxID=1964208 RepID=UPI0010F74686|nr:porin family protein [Parerythrobacter lutipelagi]
MKYLILGLAASAVLAQPAIAQDYEDRAENTPASKDGLRIEGRVMWERINDPEEDIGINYELGSGVAFGGEIGYDFYVSDSVVVGPYANYETSSVESCEGNFCVSSGGYWAAGIHAGFMTGGNGMIYGKLGYGQQTVDIEGPLDINGTIVNFDESESGGGYNAAFGYDHSFSENLYGRVEVGISESYDIYGFDFQRANVGVALGARF